MQITEYEHIIYFNVLMIYKPKIPLKKKGRKEYLNYLNIHPLK